MVPSVADRHLLLRRFCLWECQKCARPTLFQLHSVQQQNKDFLDQVLWGKSDGVKSSHPREDEALLRSHCDVLVYKRQLQRRQRLSLHKEPHGKASGSGYRLYQQSDSFLIQEIFLLREHLTPGTTSPGTCWSPCHWKFSRCD